MSAQFWPCPGCSRHVKRGDAVCPFCGAGASVEVGPTRVLAGRLSRAALFAAGAAGVAVTTSNCNSAPMIPTTTIAPAYGGPVGLPLYGGAVLPIDDSGETITIPPTDSATGSADATSAIDGSTGADGSTDAADASATTEPIDSSSADDAPMVAVFYGAFMPPPDAPSTIDE
jgi:hypothetical protein